MDDATDTGEVPLDRIMEYVATENALRFVVAPQPWGSGLLAVAADREGDYWAMVGGGRSVTTSRCVAGWHGRTSDERGQWEFALLAAGTPDADVDASRPHRDGDVRWDLGGGDVFCLRELGPPDEAGWSDDGVPVVVGWPVATVLASFVAVAGGVLATRAWYWGGDPNYDMRGFYLMWSIVFWSAVGLCTIGAATCFWLRSVSRRRAVALVPAAVVFVTLARVLAPA